MLQPPERYFYSASCRGHSKKLRKRVSTVKCHPASQFLVLSDKNQLLLKIFEFETFEMLSSVSSCLRVCSIVHWCANLDVCTSAFVLFSCCTILSVSSPLGPPCAGRHAAILCVLLWKPTLKDPCVWLGSWEGCRDSSAADCWAHWSRCQGDCHHKRGHGVKQLGHQGSQCTVTVHALCVVY